ncbi:hypothetical protein BBC27_12105 [Acidithiobacillus ferrivorans]|uniref:Uncharacterized protein n=1 Tax=Acidithiobacillus ferrivorans TaxID=160808 RepID=A0A1B9BY66_9PROT|nr:hypothetical protein [Acidithiobacillus ferrivorans]OCB02659.1 hypothetical protein BBC27_12105 [Acidithiobacillus ferrivorans]
MQKQLTREEMASYGQHRILFLSLSTEQLRKVYANTDKYADKIAATHKVVVACNASTTCRVTACTATPWC